MLRHPVSPTGPLPRRRLQLRDSCMRQQMPQEGTVGLHQQPAVPQLQGARGLRNLLKRLLRQSKHT